MVCPSRLELSDVMRAGVPSVRTEKGTVEIGIALRTQFDPLNPPKGNHMNSIIYIVGLVVIVLAILGFLGLR